MDTCELCGRAHTTADVMLVSGLALCDRCYRGDFGDGLFQRGIGVQEAEYERWIDMGGRRPVHTVEVVAALAYDLGLEARFTTENGLSRLTKFLSSELQTGDKVFDDAVLIETDDKERCAAILQHPGVRAAILDNLNEVVGSRNGDDICIEGNRCRARDRVESPRRDIPGMRRDLAVLFHYLQQVAEAEGLPRQPEKLRMPDTETLLGHMNWQGLIGVRFFNSTFPDLEPLQYLVSPMDKTQMHRLSLIDCHVLSGDLTPLRALDPLTTLAIVNAPEVTDLSPLSRLVSLKTLTLAGTGICDLTPIAGMTDLERLNIRRTRVEDIGLLAEFPRLRELRIEGAPVDPRQVADLQQALPELVVEPG
jgi:hypothetical protein